MNRAIGHCGTHRMRTIMTPISAQCANDEFISPIGRPVAPLSRIVPLRRREPGQQQSPQRRPEPQDRKPNPG